MSCFTSGNEKGKVLAAQEHNSKASKVNRKEKLQFSVSKAHSFKHKNFDAFLVLLHRSCSYFFFEDSINFQSLTLFGSLASFKQ